MAKKSKRSNRLLTTHSTAPAPAIPFDPNDPKAQALFKIRMKRWLLLALIFAFLPICTALTRYSMDLTAFAAFGMLVLGHVLYRWMNQSKCPRCEGWFFLKQTPAGQLTGSGLSFPFVNQCKSCGQSLQG